MQAATPTTPSDADGTIEARALELTFPDGTRAVCGVDLHVAAGEIFGFLGPNGAGKSTTVRMLTTLLRPTGGTALVSGIDATLHPRRVRRLIGVALQEAGLNGMSSGFELLQMHARLHGIRPAQATRRARDLLELVGLDEAADRRAMRYSGGMKRRLDLAIALVHEPRVLFLDEPTTGLDPASRHVIWDQVRRLRTEHGTTVFLTTQYLDEADQLADRVAIIDRGKIVREGTPTQLKRSVASDRVLLWTRTATQRDAAHALLQQDPTVIAVHLAGDGGSLTAHVDDGERSAPALLSALHDAGITVDRMSISEPSLDDVFLAVTTTPTEGSGS